MLDSYRPGGTRPEETHVCPAGVEEEGANRGAAQEVDDLGIEGLTITIHMKGKNDLVIKTDVFGTPGEAK